jgi:hypothetical protein
MLNSFILMFIIFSILVVPLSFRAMTLLSHNTVEGSPPAEYIAKSGYVLPCLSSIPWITLLIKAKPLYVATPWPGQAAGSTVDAFPVERNSIRGIRKPAVSFYSPEPGSYG